MPLRIKTADSDLDLEIDADPGCRLLDLATKANVPVNARCASEGICGGCTVVLEQGPFVVGDRRITVQPDAPVTALACQTELDGDDAQIRFPRSSLLEREAKIDDDFSLDLLQRVTPTATSIRQTGFGIAIDLGTTTVVAMLVDLEQQCVLAKASMYNQQIRLADDVASRIAACQGAEEVRQMQRLVVQETINKLIEKLLHDQGMSSDLVNRVAISGNTVMSHLLMGLSPQSIGQAPFQPVTTRYDRCRARDLKLAVHPLAFVDVVPSVSGYVGGDIVADMHVAGLMESATPALLVDIGTNGEIVYCEADACSVCATAAGPAFEGFGTAHGCRAAAGAIEHLAFDQNLNFEMQVIGDVRAGGICGSAMIDFIACGMRSGLINQVGRYNLELLHARDRYLKVDGLCGPVHACALVNAEQTAGGETISISEADLAQILKAKAAIYAGMKTLLRVHNRQFADLQRLCLAGAFARHLNLANAITIGVLPAIPTERVDWIGNGSLAGAMLTLIDAHAMDHYHRIAGSPRVVQLNRVASFENDFIDALALPNLNPDDRPGVNP